MGVLAVVKADAYGHGAVPVARALAGSPDVAGLAVSLSEEGLELRRAGVGGEILVLGGVYTGAHRELVLHDLVAVVSEEADVEAFARAARGVNTRARIHVKLDTGMSRLGVRPERLAGFLARVAAEPNVVMTGFCTHLASADSSAGGATAGDVQTAEQLRLFDAAIPAARAAAGGPILVHAANSAATLRFPAARYDAVRPGLAVFGGQSLHELRNSQLAGVLEPAMRFVTGVAQLRDVAAGDTVSYGALWRAPAAARLATLPVGYADGYPRRLTGSGEVLIGGRRCPVVGAVCMDMTIADVTALGDRVAVGDEAVLLGAQGDERVTAAELAGRAGLIEYEITCGISKRVPRVYVGDA